MFYQVVLQNIIFQTNGAYLQHIFKGVAYNERQLSLICTLREKCPYSELFWSAFSRIRTEYGEIIRISWYSIQMRENADQNNCGYKHFLRSEMVLVEISYMKHVTW